MAKRKAAESPAPDEDSFEGSLTELQSIVSELEDGSLGLEASLARFERGVGLLRQCHVILDSAEQKIETLTRFDDDVPPPASRIKTAGASEPVDGGIETDDEPGSRHDAAAAANPDITKSSLF